MPRRIVAFTCLRDDLLPWPGIHPVVRVPTLALGHGSYCRPVRYQAGHVIRRQSIYLPPRGSMGISSRQQPSFLKPVGLQQLPERLRLACILEGQYPDPRRHAHHRRESLAQFIWFALQIGAETRLLGHRHHSSRQQEDQNDTRFHKPGF